MMQINAETYKEYVKRLLDLDYTKLGEGGFGTVFQHPCFDNVAVKVVKQDRAYRKFASFCIENPHNPWLPRIASVKSIKLDDANLAYVVFMEKLQPVTPAYVAQLKQAMQSKYGLRLWSDTQWFNRASWRAIATHKDTPPDFAELAAYFATNLNNIDLVPSNFMRRGNQLVFNDPMAG